MMKMKKFLAVAMALTLMGATSITVCANTQSLKLNGYETLTGTLISSGNFTTKVTTNPDRAYLTIAGTIQDVNGNTIYNQSQINSDRGVKSYSGYYQKKPANAYAIFGAHGVQGGSTYGAGAVYTYTRA